LIKIFDVNLDDCNDFNLYLFLIKQHTSFLLTQSKCYTRHCLATNILIVHGQSYDNSRKICLKMTSTLSQCQLSLSLQYKYCAQDLFLP